MGKRSNGQVNVLELTESPHHAKQNGFRTNTKISAERGAFRFVARIRNAVDTVDDRDHTLVADPARLEQRASDSVAHAHGQMRYDRSQLIVPELPIPPKARTRDEPEYPALSDQSGARTRA
jgi:hypothetical protein